MSDEKCQRPGEKRSMVDKGARDKTGFMCHLNYLERGVNIYRLHSEMVLTLMMLQK